MMKGSIHVRPVIFMDAELPFVPDRKAPGISDYRTQIASVLHDYEVQSRLHQSLIDEVAQDGAQYMSSSSKPNSPFPTLLSSSTSIVSIGVPKTSAICAPR